MAGFNDVVVREAAWYTVDPPPGFASAPALQAVNGGPFDGIQAYWTKVPQRQRWLFVTCEGEVRNELDEWQAHREAIYQMVLTILWSFEAGSGALEDEQQNLHDAVEKVLQRVYGLIGDKTHNSQFTAVAAGGPEGDGRITVRMPNSYDQVTARQPLMAEIRYFATDWLPGGS